MGGARPESLRRKLNGHPPTFKMEIKKKKIKEKVIEKIVYRVYFPRQWKDCETLADAGNYLSRLGGLGFINVKLLIKKRRGIK